MSFSTSISSVFLPKVTMMVSDENSPKIVSDLFIKTGRIQYIIISFVLVGFILFGKPFITLWAGKEYAQVYNISVLLFISMTVPLIQNLGNTILRARNEMRFQSILYVSISICCLFMQIYLAKFYGAMGCAFAIALTQIIGHGIIMNIYYNRKQAIDIGVFWKNILRMSIVPCVLCVSGYLLIRYIEFDTIFRLIMAISLFSIVYIGVFWKTSMNDYERNLFKMPLINLWYKLQRK